MFRSSKNRLRVWLSLADDVLGDPEDREEFVWEDYRDRLATHPHRKPLRWQRARRPGTVPPPPAHCISPVRATTRVVLDRAPARTEPHTH